MLLDMLRRLVGDKKREPARLVSRLTAGAVAIAGLLALWGLNLGPEWTDRIQGTIAAVVPAAIAIGEFIRPYVANVHTVAAAVADAKVTPAASAAVPDVDMPGYQDAVKAALSKSPLVPPVRFVELSRK